jgi:hypothetical protein
MDNNDSSRGENYGYMKSTALISQFNLNKLKKGLKPVVSITLSRNMNSSNTFSLLSKKLNKTQSCLDINLKKKSNELITLYKRCTKEVDCIEEQSKQMKRDFSQIKIGHKKVNSIVINKEDDDFILPMIKEKNKTDKLKLSDHIKEKLHLSTKLNNVSTFKFKSFLNKKFKVYEVNHDQSKLLVDKNFPSFNINSSKVKISSLLSDQRYLKKESVLRKMSRASIQV